MFKTQQSKPREAIEFIHGLKVIFTSILVWYNCKILLQLHPKLSTPGTNSLAEDFKIEVLLLAQLFTITGFLVAHSFLTKVKNSTILNCLAFAAIRWIRFVSLLVIFFLVSILFQKLGSGPLFHPDLTQ